MRLNSVQSNTNYYDYYDNSEIESSSSSIQNTFTYRCTGKHIPRNRYFQNYQYEKYRDIIPITRTFKGMEEDTRFNLIKNK